MGWPAPPGDPARGPAPPGRHPARLRAATLPGSTVRSAGRTGLPPKPGTRPPPPLTEDRARPLPWRTAEPTRLRLGPGWLIRSIVAPGRHGTWPTSPGFWTRD